MVAVLAGLVMIFGPAGRVPLMDSNRTLLAETPAEGYCAAPAHFKGWGQAQFDACVEQSNRPNEIAISEVIPNFCVGVLDEGWPGSMSDCQAIVESGQLWPTKEPTPRGWLTDSWNGTFPYPGSLLGRGAQTPDESRTGDRDGNLRDGEVTRP